MAKCKTREWDAHADVLKMRRKIQLLRIKFIVIGFRDWCKLMSAFISNKTCILICYRVNTVQHLVAAMNK